MYVGPGVTITREDLAPLDASGEWVFEEKKDGFWCLATVEDGVIVAMASRVGLEFEGAEVAGLFGCRVALTGSGRLVGELTADAASGSRSGLRRLHLFDVLDWNGLDLRSLPQTDRREALCMIYETLTGDNVHLVEQRKTGAVAFFDQILAAGGEGVVAKRRDAKYRAVNADGKIEAWVRAKKQNSQDMVVIAHGVAKKGTPNLELGMYRKGNLVKIQTCTLPSGWSSAGLEGAVVEVVGWEIFPSGAVRSGHVKRLRKDKRAEDCV